MKKNVDDFVTNSVTVGYIFYDMQKAKSVRNSTGKLFAAENLA